MKLAIYSDLHLELLGDRTWQPPLLDVDVVNCQDSLASSLSCALRNLPVTPFNSLLSKSLP